MTRLLDDAWPELAPRLAAAPALLACFDYDGTLVGIRPTPEEAVADDDVRRALARLAAARATRVAVVSGRPVDELRAFLGDELFLIGHHGLSVAPPGEPARLALDLDDCRRRLAPLRAAGERLAAAHAGVRLEDKGAMLALHTRLAERPAAAAAGREFAAAAADIEGYEVMRGKEVVEARPRGFDKGRALAPLVGELPPDGAVLYTGDDVTDEDAFRALAQPGEGGGERVTVLVGERPDTAARYRVETQEEVLDLLHRLAELRSG